MRSAEKTARARWAARDSRAFGSGPCARGSAPGRGPVDGKVVLLEFLLRNRERVVSKDDVIAAVWDQRIVSDAALTTRMNVARSAIGDSGEDQRLIKT